ncbi:MAG: hypothetical protein JWP85_635 [Rhodoglobus sp.]|nr:hypothetical protein [Rhodoglobus sp.]
MIGAVITCAVFAIVIGGLFGVAYYLQRHPEKRGASSRGSGMLTASFDEIFHPSAPNARDDLDREKRLVVPAPAPDGDRGVADGRIRIDLR